jgi:hypothetical protein
MTIQIPDPAPQADVLGRTVPSCMPVGDEMDLIPRRHHPLSSRS